MMYVHQSSSLTKNLLVHVRVELCSAALFLKQQPIGVGTQILKDVAGAADAKIGYRGKYIHSDYLSLARLTCNLDLYAVPHHRD
jgi:hypothetical protein